MGGQEWVTGLQDVVFLKYKRQIFETLCDHLTLAMQSHHKTIADFYEYCVRHGKIPIDHFRVLKGCSPSKAHAPEYVEDSLVYVRQFLDDADESNVGLQVDDGRALLDTRPTETFEELF